MPFCSQILTGQTMRQAATQPPPFGPGFSPEQIAQATTLEIWHSSFKDPGPDWTEFRLLANGRQLASQKQVGY